MPPLQLISDSWRERISHLALSAERSLLLAAPFIKENEARRIVEMSSPAKKAGSLSLTVLTDLRPESILSESLDMEALGLLSREFTQSNVFSVPRLHAKVYIADGATAIIGSANLTPSALDLNREYGVLIEDTPVVRQIEDDMRRFSRLGSNVAPGTLSDLKDIADEIKGEFRELQRSANAGFRRRFSAVLRRAHARFVATQVGTRSANAVFSEAILYVLARRPRTTRELHPQLQRLLPDLCDDSLELIINGESFGKKWKHHVRNAQQSLKRAGLVHLDGTVWSKTEA